MNNLAFPLDIPSLKEYPVFNIKENIPENYFNINKYNEIAFTILKHLDFAFNECNQLLLKNSVNKNNNLIVLFYHHINGLLCSYYFSIKEIQEINYLHKNLTYTDQEKEWAISYSQIKPNDNKNLWLSQYKLKNSIKKLRNRFNDYIGNLNLNTYEKNTKVFIHPGVSQELDTIIEELKKKNIRVHNNVKYFENRVNILLYKEQLFIIKNNLNNLIDDLKTITKIKAFTNKELYHTISEKIIKHIELKDNKKYNYDLVILDSLGNLESRKIAIQCKLQNIPLMGVSHGESIGDLDEPLFGAVEQAYLDYYIGYGQKGCDVFKLGMYNKNLFNDDLIIIPSNSNKVLKIYENKYINKINAFKSSHVMYVPTSFNGNARYGPFRDIHDFAYLSWQLELLNAIKKDLMPLKLTIKFHPKDRFNFYLDIPELEVIKNGNLSDNIDKSDVFIFDFPTSAFSLALATNKPVIYFDIGLRNLSKIALEDIKKRCIYIRANPLNAADAINKVSKCMADKKTNHYTENYSLCDGTKSREESIISAIHSIISPFNNLKS